MLVNRKPCGLLSADFNCIADNLDSLKYAEQKISPTLKRFIHVFNLSDSFRCLHPDAKVFSRYGSAAAGEGATRLDRTYHYGELKIVAANYVGASFTDHLCLIVEAEIPGKISTSVTTQSCPLFKANQMTVKDSVFQSCSILFSFFH